MKLNERIKLKMSKQIIPQEGWEDSDGFHHGKEPLPNHDESPFMDQYQFDSKRTFSELVFLICVIGLWTAGIIYLVAEVLHRL